MKNGSCYEGMTEQNQHKQALTTSLRRYIQAKAAAKSGAQLRRVQDARGEELAELPLLRSALQGTSEEESQLRENQHAALKIQSRARGNRVRNAIVQPPKTFSVVLKSPTPSQARTSNNLSNHKGFQQIASFSLHAIYGAGDSVAAGQLSASAGHAAPVAARSLRGGAERSNA